MLQGPYVGCEPFDFVDLRVPGLIHDHKIDDMITDMISFDRDRERYLALYLPDLSGFQ